MCVCECVCMPVCVCVCMPVCVYACVCICLCVYMQTPSPQIPATHVCIALLSPPFLSCPPPPLSLIHPFPLFTPFPYSPTAGRYDIHHAVRYLGGYREVAHALDRRPTWPRRPALRHDFKALAAELQVFVEEMELPEKVMPSSQRLLEEERGDIVSVGRGGVWGSVGGVGMVGGGLECRMGMGCVERRTV